MKSRTRKVAVTAAIAAVVVGAVVLLNFKKLVPVVGSEVNRVRDLEAPVGTLTTEVSSSSPVTITNTPNTESTEALDWPSYNKALTSERYSGLAEINKTNVEGLHVVCTYDTKQHTSFQTGLIMVNGAIIGTTAGDTFSIDANTCQEKWRVHEEYEPASLLSVNRGAVFLDGRLFRGTQDGRVLAYDAATGKKLWSTQLGYFKLGETVPSAPIAWNGMVFVGNAGGDNKGVKGRMYALDAPTGKILWEYYMVPKAPDDPVRGPQGAGSPQSDTWKVPQGQPITGGGMWTSYTLDPKSGLLYVPGGNPAPDYAAQLREGSNLYADSVVVLNAKTGAYVKHFKIVPRDWHDWDVGTTPILVHTRGGLDLMSLAPKDGHLYGFDLANDRMLYRQAVTKMENDDEPFSTDKDVHFCPGATGGAEWNGPAYDPQTNLIAIGEVDWCSTARLESDAAIEKAPMGEAWFGMKFLNPYHALGKPDAAFTHWGGWVYGVDADSGEWKWRIRTNYPILSGMTPTAGGVIFFGDVGGNFYAVDAATGQKLFWQKFKGALAAGVITYTANGSQKVAVATGMEAIFWPTEQSSAKVVVLGL